MTNISKTAQEFREKISNFCINECKAKCCKRGYLLLQTDKEVEAIVGDNKEKYLAKEILEKSQFGYLYNSSKLNCKNLDKNNLCTIHKSTNRPIVCRDYPIFVFQTKIKVGGQCDAYLAGLLNDFIKIAKKEGFEIIH